MTTLNLDLLLLLRGAGRFGIELSVALPDLRRGRHRELTLPELERAMRDLADARFATQFTSALGASRWRITALGESALQEEGV